MSGRRATPLASSAVRLTLVALVVSAILAWAAPVGAKPEGDSKGKTIGHTDAPPGKGATPPGHGGTPPGQTNKPGDPEPPPPPSPDPDPPPGQGGDPPGQGGDPPGQGGGPPNSGGTPAGSGGGGGDGPGKAGAGSNGSGGAQSTKSRPASGGRHGRTSIGANAVEGVSQVTGGPRQRAFEDAAVSYAVERFADLGQAFIDAAAPLRFPLLLSVLVVLFLLLHHRVDSREPKLARSPLTAASQQVHFRD